MMSINVNIKGLQVARNMLGRYQARLPRAMERAIKKEGQNLSGMIKTGMRRQAPGGKKFKPLAESTKMMKESSKALIDHGDLLRSVNVSMFKMGAEAGQAAFIGVHRTVKNKDGESMANIAEIHEFGTKPFKIPVTPKMRAYLNFLHDINRINFVLGPKTKVINHPGVPERPFLRPSFEEWQKGLEQRFNQHVAFFLRKG